MKPTLTSVSMLFTALGHLVSTSQASPTRLGSNATNGHAYPRLHPGPERSVTVVTTVWKYPADDLRVNYAATGVIFGATEFDGPLDVDLFNSRHLFVVSRTPDVPSRLHEKYPDDEHRQRRVLQLRPTTWRNGEIFDPSLGEDVELGLTRSVLAEVWVRNARVADGMQAPPPWGNYPFERSGEGVTFAFLRELLVTSRYRLPAGTGSQGDDEVEVGRLREQMREQSEWELGEPGLMNGGDGRVIDSLEYHMRAPMTAGSRFGGEEEGMVGYEIDRRTVDYHVVRKW